jgi:hypothetical protein
VLKTPVHWPIMSTVVSVPGASAAGTHAIDQRVAHVAASP